MNLGLLTVGAGGAIVIALVAWFGAQSIGAEVLQAGWAVPFTTALLFFQLWLSALAWRASVGAPKLRVGRYFRIRWIREAVNSLLPVAQLGGNIVGIRLLVHRGVPGNVAGAGTTLDLTIEALTQFIFTVLGFVVLSIIDRDRSWAGWVQGALGTGALGIGGFIVAQRFGLMRLIELLADRIQRFFPSFSADAVRGLHEELMRLQGNRGALLRATLLHMLAWMLGTLECWLALTAMGVSITWGQAFVIESLGMALRNAGFAVPGALGVQEAAFILVCSPFGVPAETAVALSMVKRVRELGYGLTGLAAWQWSEGRRLVRAIGAPPRAASDGGAPAVRAAGVTGGEAA